ncbi:universal stress protein [Polaribacter vadi]|uniref:Universal stress protein n=1 Tax=Polaribacter vadi TaxID=1774273 RepID=A0A1B8TX25_9FLAO|nr:universal stress protein [Polaribacter vadi]AOW16825.1 universal stress protein [Polaribacter vadi]OBY64266.1 universal stress protein [Polaribacter vadi]
MQKKILLPTDFSDNAWNAIIYALKLYANETCDFYLLNSIKIKGSTMSNFSSKLSNTIRKSAFKDMLELKQMIERVNANANHNFEILVSNADLKDALETAIKKHTIQLIIMGTKGASGAKEFFFGSNTVNVINKVRLCPILTIPDQFDFVEPKKIAFSTDFNRLYKEEELAPLKEVTDLYNSEINIVHLNNEEHLNEVQEYNSKILENDLKDYNHHFFWIPNYGKKANDINDFIKEQNINMLAMVNYKHSFIEKITKEPVIKTIGFQPFIPFLVIPE